MFSNQQLLVNKDACLRRDTTKIPLYLHLTYNPVNLPSASLQKAFKNEIIQPNEGDHISTIDTENPFHGTPDFDRCVICYSGQTNIGTILAPRKHRFGTNFSVRTYLVQLRDG